MFVVQGALGRKSLMRTLPLFGFGSYRFRVNKLELELVGALVILLTDRNARRVMRRGGHAQSDLVLRNASKSRSLGQTCSATT